MQTQSSSRHRLAALSALPVLVLALAMAAGVALALPGSWTYEWPKTDFSKHSVDLDEILSGGPPKDGIPSIDHPAFLPLSEVTDLPDREPVIGFQVGDDVRCYPLRILMWHEIVNDTVGGLPVAVTFCPLCNAAIVFDRRVDGRVLEFGTTGKLRFSDLVMYDRQTESWWQQFLGEAIVGEMTGKTLKMLPARIESFAKFRERAPNGKVLVPDNLAARRYGMNPYVRYDSSSAPFLYRGDLNLPANVAPLHRLVTVDGEAWTLSLLRRDKTVETGDLVIRWEPDQASALDNPVIAEGFDVGNVTVQRKTENGLEDVVYGVDFAFVFNAFYPDATIHTE
ncbi:MAG: DUF3179 domain-containing protein [Alphaproteobacteria bacterium]